ncbi:RNA-binding S4 domain-containing protein [Acidisoma sp. 7E03]
MSGRGGKPGGAGEDSFQRLDMWLWCARVARARSDCARLVEEGGLRLNRQPTLKPHAKLRVGDVLTMALRGEVRVWRVLALAQRRGPAPEARLLYEEVLEPGRGPAPFPGDGPCTNESATAYGSLHEAPDSGTRGDASPALPLDRGGAPER